MAVLFPLAFPSCPRSARHLARTAIALFSVAIASCLPIKGPLTALSGTSEFNAALASELIAAEEVHAEAATLSIEDKITAINETAATSAVMRKMMIGMSRYMATLEDAHASFVSEREALLHGLWKPGEYRPASLALLPAIAWTPPSSAVLTVRARPWMAVRDIDLAYQMFRKRQLSADGVSLTCGVGGMIAGAFIIAAPLTGGLTAGGAVVIATTLCGLTAAGVSMYAVRDTSPPAVYYDCMIVTVLAVATTVSAESPARSRGCILRGLYSPPLLHDAASITLHRCPRCHAFAAECAVESASGGDRTRCRVRPTQLPCTNPTSLSHLARPHVSRSHDVNSRHACNVVGAQGADHTRQAAAAAPPHHDAPAAIDAEQPDRRGRGRSAGRRGDGDRHRAGDHRLMNPDES